MLEEIRPIINQRVIDLVEQAGLDVNDWANYKGPAAANPKYCYQWHYIDESVGLVLNLWFDQCKVENQNIIQNHNFREDSKRYSKPIWARRATLVDCAIRTAIQKHLPIRVILLDGVRKNLKTFGSKPSKVKKRILDPEFWQITSYDEDSGEVTFSRGIGPISSVDQFSLLQLGNEIPKEHDIINRTFKRNPQIRTWVLSRAGGRCEYCGAKGFSTPNGTTYLETHHIIALSEGGPDTVGNVIALCPNHHREAHYGSSLKELREKFVQKVSGCK